MGEWPDDWFRDGTADAGGANGAAGAGDKTVSVPPAQHPGGQYQVRQYPGDAAGAGQRPAAPPGSWPQQPPLSAGAGSGAGGGVAAPVYSPGRTVGPRGPRGPRWRRWLRPKRVASVIAVVIALLLVASVGTYFYLNSKLHRSNILVNYAGRPSPGSGTNWLIAGSDSRQGLTRAQERKYSTGFDVSGGRSDTIMILHMPAGGGQPLLISIPRDSYVDIPGYGFNKINAAFDFGGPKLLAETIQDTTGLYINHFMDIGFGGFVQVVNDVGGVRMCFKRALNDRASGVHLQKGCQVLNGGEALAYVRDRHSFATQDLQREQDQRVFLSALLKKMTSAGVVLNPFKALPAASGVVGTLTVDEGTSLYDLYGVARAMRDAETTTVPIANSNYITSAGDAVQWNQSQAKELFNDLQSGQTVPKSLITGSHKAG